MGVAVSTHTTTYPLSLASSIIGVVSFVFTVGTFLRVVWVNLMTMSEAPHEIHSYLTNLRQELLEERSSLRMLKRFQKSRRKGNVEIPYMSCEMDEVTIKTMQDTIKHLIRQFNQVEKPFLEPGEKGIADAPRHRNRRRDQSTSPNYTHSAYGSPPEKGYTRDRSRARDRDDDDNDYYWAQRVQYANLNFKRRLQWLFRKGDAQRLFGTLSRLQTRRIARQVSGLAVVMHDYGGSVVRMEDNIRNMDERLGRVFGRNRDE